ncbi:MAG: hypothetical protein AMXMBFR33_05320 [Candidatus Xenobia bacterium]
MRRRRSRGPSTGEPGQPGLSLAIARVELEGDLVDLGRLGVVSSPMVQLASADVILGRLRTLTHVTVEFGYLESVLCLFLGRDVHLPAFLRCCAADIRGFAMISLRGNNPFTRRSTDAAMLWSK